MKCIYKNRLGLEGERIAKNFLLKKNLNFIKSNYKYDRAEADLIFENVNEKLLIFVEVKTRRTLTYGEPEESVSKTKQHQIKKAAMGFVLENEQYRNHDLRIDVIAIMLRDGKAEINHIENAF